MDLSGGRHDGETDIGLDGGDGGGEDGNAGNDITGGESDGDVVKYVRG